MTSSTGNHKAGITWFGPVFVIGLWLHCRYGWRCPVVASGRFLLSLPPDPGPIRPVAPERRIRPGVSLAHKSVNAAAVVSVANTHRRHRHQSNIHVQFPVFCHYLPVVRFTAMINWELIIHMTSLCNTQFGPIKAGGNRRHTDRDASGHLQANLANGHYHQRSSFFAYSQTFFSIF